MAGNDSTASPLCQIYVELERYLAYYNMSTENLTDLQLNSYMYSESNESILALFNILLPVICMLGIVGNFMNLVVLTKKRHSSVIGKLERSANLGLTALAFSDFMFSLLVVIYTFTKGSDLYAQPESAYKLYCRIYGGAGINLFLMTSTWLIVMLAVERYIVLFYPFRAKLILGLNRDFIIIGSIFGLSIILTLPHCLQTKVAVCTSPNDSLMYEIVRVWNDGNDTLSDYLYWAWPMISVIVPLFVLLFCNVRLLQGLHRATKDRRNHCPGQVVKETNSRITLTLTVIVFMALLLITPSEVVKISFAQKPWSRAGDIAAAITNVLQSINFAFNFILYCVVDGSFRRTCKKLCTFTKGNKPQQRITMRASSFSKASQRSSPSRTELKKMSNGSISNQREISWYHHIPATHEKEHSVQTK